MTPDTKADLFLSKSLFIRGLQCHKSLYLHKYRPELKDEIDDAREAMFQRGFDVGRLAQGLFPGGIQIPYDGLTHDEQLNMTQQAIRAKTSTLYEPAFFHNGVFVKADILHRRVRGWELCEVKSSASLKDVHLDDAAIQYYVLRGSDLPVTKVSVAVINNQYVRNGEINVGELFTLHDVTSRVKQLQPKVEKALNGLKEMLSGPVPVIDIGEHCSDPYGCDFQGHCWQHLPEDSVFSLKGRGVNKFELYRQGIIRLKEIPKDILNAKQRMQVEAALGKKRLVDYGSLRQFLSSLWYPRYFLDFETFSTPVPLYDLTSPYQQVPFQFSLHWIERKGGKVYHKEFLGAPNTDPRKEIVSLLADSIPDTACVITYTSFEDKRLNELAGACPKYRRKVDKLIGNIRDLAGPFQKRHVYDWQMAGSYSIKEVLPALIPVLTYDNMEIANGSMAMEAYFSMCGSSDPAEIKSIRRSLLEYCKLDTLAMVKLLEKLEALAA